MQDIAYAQLELIAAIAAFLAAAAIYPFYIHWLKLKQIGQFIREEGPQSHALKAKTPTMGGLCFMLVSITVVAVTLGWGRLVHFNALIDPQLNHSLWTAVAVMGSGAICGLIGFVDDYAKLKGQSNRGLSARTRLIIEFLVGSMFAGCLYFLGALLIPSPFITSAMGINLIYIAGIYLVVIIPFLIAATANAVNLHDGMDGLAAGTAIQIFSCLAVMLVLLGHTELSCIAASMVGALSGFLIYNRCPARIFMGDTGSLFIGGLLAALVIGGGLVLWFIPLSLIYIAETLSVIAQVSYFKLTKPYTPPPDKLMTFPAMILFKLTHKLPGQGKRLFRMAPLHHHFEALAAERGIEEWKVVICIWLIQFIVCATTLIAFINSALRGTL